MRGKSIFLPLLIIGEIFCIFDEEIIMEKPIKKSALFFRALNENEYYISNSESNIIFNIRNGNKRNFTGIIPQDSTIYEPYLLFVNKNPSFFIDAYHINDFIKIYDISNNVYKEYTALKIKDGYKRKFCKFGLDNDDRFVVGVQDENDNFFIRLVNANGTEIFRSQNINIKDSDDFYISTSISKDNKAIYAVIFYESKFIMHQWARTKNGNVIYNNATEKSNQFVKHFGVQMTTNGVYCTHEDGDVNCHIMRFKYQGGFTTKVFNMQMLQNCKTDFKLNILNGERYVVSCLTMSNEYIIQLFSTDLKRDFDMNGMTLFKDEPKDDFTYDVIKGKNNELVVLKADLKRNRYFIETFVFIKDPSGKYVLCPQGCQSCYYKYGIGLQIGKKVDFPLTLNCTLCKFNSYFADNYADLCFLKKERPKGYEYMESFHKFSSCEYCCKTHKADYICNVCLNEMNYEYFVDRPNNGKCANSCIGSYNFVKINKDEKICTNKCDGLQDCQSYESYINNTKDNPTD